jgi:hypothetical protein
MTVRLEPTTLAGHELLRAEVRSTERDSGFALARSVLRPITSLIRNCQKGEPHAGERHYRGEQHCGERPDKNVWAGPIAEQDCVAKRYWPDR